MEPDSTFNEMVAALVRGDEVLRANETDHDLAVLVRKLKETSHAQ